MMLEKESTEYGIEEKGVRMLVVENDPSTRELLREFLLEEGWTVKLAQDGKEALLKVRKESFDLVLTDLKMPRMNGIQLLKEMRKIAPHIRVIAMSATGDSRTAVKMKELGVCDFITKPFYLNSVLQKVKKALEGGNGKAEN